MDGRAEIADSTAMPRIIVRLLLCLVGSLACMPAFAAPASPPAQAARFAAFIQSLWADASAAGVTRATFDAAFAGVAFDPSVLARTRRQAEFDRPIRDYLAGATAPSQVARGRALAQRWAEPLAAIERRFGVDRHIVLALWGLESGYGANTGGKDAISALANLAFVGFRGGLFRDELIVALTILQQGHVARADMKSSWAGAMGQAQFLPSSFVKYAVALDGGTRKDIWDSVPDVLASIANFMKASEWQAGLPWGFEVTLPRGYDHAVDRASFAAWAKRGVARADGAPMPASGEALMFFPAGWRGPALLITRNFFVIKAYNTSDAYALSAGVLADRIAGGAGIAHAWPPTTERLDRADLLEAQRGLARLGLYDDKLDGRLGPALRAATFRFQSANGLIADGFPTREMLAKLRAAH